MCAGMVSSAVSRAPDEQEADHLLGWTGYLRGRDTEAGVSRSAPGHLKPCALPEGLHYCAAGRVKGNLPARDKLQRRYLRCLTSQTFR